MEPTLRRHQELIDKGELTDDERAELRELTIAMARSKGAGNSSGTGPVSR